MRKALKYLLCFIALFAQEAVVSSETILPLANITTRVLMIQSQYGRGSVFSIDIDGREYWITAKHILNGRESPPYGTITGNTASLRILNPGLSGQQWLSEDFKVLDPGKDIDIAVLVPSHALLSHPMQTILAGSDNINLGQECDFIGYPYGGGWRATMSDGTSGWMPFVKRCSISALISEGNKIWVLDGINNVGFSGGPVILGSGPQQTVFAVISGYHQEPADVIPADSNVLAPNQVNVEPVVPSPKQKVNVNSGFILAFDISYAINAIRKEPIGPLRASK